jgi:hypothetical protein
MDEEDKTYPKEISVWCFAEDPGDYRVCLPAFPCRQEKCDRYRKEYPYCVMVSRAAKKERIERNAG